MADETCREQILNSFRRMDLNGDGTISRLELRRVFCSLDGDFGDSKVDQLLDGADRNGDGRIQYEEFVRWVLEGGERDPRAAIGWRSFMPERIALHVSTRYSLDRLLGEGGFGQVFIARDNETDRSVVVKKVTKTGDTVRSEMFDAEIQIMQELDHPNICRLLEVYEHHRQIFLVMEHLEGGEVFDRIVETKGISEAMTADIIAQVNAALHYAHGRKIAHRDVKPENVVFCAKDIGDTRVKLIDWGLSTFFDRGDMSAQLGSPTYAAPEVMDTSSPGYTEACDIWSLGVLTYVMMSGKPPFWGSRPQHLRNAKAEKYPLSAGTPPWSGVSDEGRDFIRQLLRADPSDRPTADEVAAHPWLSKKDFIEDVEAQAEVLGNIKSFVKTGAFNAICISAVARQLDHRQLKDIHQVFREMDRNGDGYLCIDEVKLGFRNIHGENSAEYRAISESFSSLDVDGSGIVDYTEFCAAGMGQHMVTQEDAIWAAFKTFDADNTGKIEMQELKAVLANADVKKAWTEAVCDDVAAKVLEKWDKNEDGSIDVDEYMHLMRQSFNDSLEVNESTKAGSSGKHKAWVYDMLQQVSNLDFAISAVPDLRRSSAGPEKV